jgi:hypothetical protein
VKKTLPFRVPEIACMPMDANIQAILLNYEKACPWLLSQFVQLWACEPEQEDFFIYFLTSDYWYGCPYLQTQEIHKGIISLSVENKVKFLKNCIDSETYVIVPVDTYYIKQYSSDVHFPHEAMFYGYDETSLYFADFFNGNYGSAVCNFKEFENAFYASENYYDWHNVVRLAKVDIDKRHPKFELGLTNDFDFHVIIELLSDFLKGYNSQLRYRIAHSYGDFFLFRKGGSKVYDIMSEHVAKSVETKSKLRIKVFYVLLAHKLFMEMRFKYTKTLIFENELDKLMENYKEVISLVRLMINIAIKYNVNGKINLTKIANILSQIRENEALIYAEYIKLLQNNISLNPISVGNINYVPRSYELL